MTARAAKCPLECVASVRGCGKWRGHGDNGRISRIRIKPLAYLDQDGAEGLGASDGVDVLDAGHADVCCAKQDDAHTLGGGALDGSVWQRCAHSDCLFGK